ncbi:ATP-binding protein [Rhizobium subbaraonis]|uniref:ATP-binding protein n=1 Tax=Rhizobium subbaraonis TaxID=908946 RepID=UPI00387E9EB1
MSDGGSGFRPDLLDDFGKPYCTTKSRTGAGLGLFLVVNVIRKLGGTVAAKNADEGGACVTLTLPVAALKSAA